MDFIIKFTTLKAEGKLLDENAILKYNLKTLDMVREELDLPNISSDKVMFRQKVDYCESSYDVHISEELARKIPYMQDNYYVKVLIPDNFLKPYQKLRCNVLDTEKTTFDKLFNRRGNVTAVEVVNEIDNDRLIKDWISNNCPIRWNTSGDI